MPITAFFVTLKRRPISLAQIPSFHNVMSTAVRSGVHSRVISSKPRPLATKTVTSLFATTKIEDKNDSMLRHFPHTVHEELSPLPRWQGVILHCAPIATPAPCRRHPVWRWKSLSGGLGCQAPTGVPSGGRRYSVQIDPYCFPALDLLLFCRTEKLLSGSGDS